MDVVKEIEAFLDDLKRRALRIVEDLDREIKSARDRGVKYFVIGLTDPDLYIDDICECFIDDEEKCHELKYDGKLSVNERVFELCTSLEQVLGRDLGQEVCTKVMELNGVKATKTI